MLTLKRNYSYPCLRTGLICLALTFLLLFSCSPEQESHEPGVLQPEVTLAKGRLMQHDSIQQPQVVRAGDPAMIRVGSPGLSKANPHVRAAGKPRVTRPADLQVYTPGEDTCRLPETFPVKETLVPAGIPHVVEAKDPVIRDQNPSGFSSYGKLQGLTHNIIRCLMQDRTGNIWLGTYGSGISRFDGRYFAHYSVQEGLGNNYVFCMLEDDQGRIWLGTDGGGLIRFDGKSFATMGPGAGPGELRVTCLLQDRKGSIWFGTRGSGVYRYDGTMMTHYTMGEGLNSNEILCLMQDHAGNIWMGTDGGGASCFNGQSFTCFTQQQGLGNNRVQSLYEDAGHQIWFGTNGGGVSRYDGRFFYTYSTPEGLSDDNVYCIDQDRSGNLWLGTEAGGLTRFDGRNFTHFGYREGLGNLSITDVLEDKGGTLWFATFGGGLTRYQGTVFSHYTRQEGLSSSDIYGLYSDRSGNIWMGPSGGGVIRYDGKEFAHFNAAGGLDNTTVLSILQDDDGKYWFGTNGKGVSCFDGSNLRVYSTQQGLGSNYVFCILEDRSGDLWFGTYGGGVSRFNGKTFTHYTVKQGLCSNYILSMGEDKKGNIWFGSFGGGISRFDGRHFTHYSGVDGLANGYVYSIAEDDLGNLWFGTNGGGVFRFDGRTVAQYTEKQGLSNNAVLCLLNDSKGNLWLGTRSGFNKIATHTLEALRVNEDLTIPFFSPQPAARSPVPFTTYTYEDGFLGIGCSRGSICEGPEGNIWTGANERITVYHPSGDRGDTTPPSIHLTGVELFYERIPWTVLEHGRDTVIRLGNEVRLRNFRFSGTSPWYPVPKDLSLAHENNHLVFRFIGITRRESQKVRYQYRLDEADIGWSALTERNEASYGNLSPGTYTFRVRAMNSGGYWSEEYRYTFAIRPPWWKAWWFRMISVLAAVSVVLGFYRWRIRLLKKQKRQLEETVREKTSELVQQNESMVTINEELKTTNEILDSQKAELEATLHSLKETQNKLIQSEKMASLGTLAAGIAHEINNPLNFIQGGIAGLENIIRDKMPDQLEELAPLIHSIQEGVTRAAHIVTSLNHYSRRSDTPHIPCDIHAILENCLVMLHNQIRTRIGVEKHFTNRFHILLGNEGKLHQALLNILANAVQSIAHQGRIVLSTTIEDAQMIIRVADDGSGIDPEDMPRVMDPFFTTKPPGKGTGLGLAITYGIIGEHRGSIEFTSQVNRGTTVKITLPLAE